jgi:aspartate/glutamate racemase
MIVKGGRAIYGEAIGICIVDKSGPLIPGNVGNSSTYDFPVRIKIVKGLKDSPFLPIRDDSGKYTKDAQLFMDALKELEDEGVRAITGACGFFSLFQREAVKILKIPFFSSPLMLIPMIARMIQPNHKIGIITASAKRLTWEYLKPVGVDESYPIIIAGMDDAAEFNAVIMKETKLTMDTETVKKEVVEVAKDLVSTHPEIGAIVLECSDMPPFAADILNAVERPVFDYICLVNMIFHSVVQKRYSGIL